MLRILIADDEPLARARIKHFIQTEPALEITGESVDGFETIDAIRRLKPDLVLLDIQMPGVDGFGVIGSIGPEHMPPVIFVTAFDQFAIRAFEVNAVDYLLKPFERQRLLQAIDKVRDLSHGQRDEAAAKLRSLLQAVPAAQSRQGRLIIKEDDRLVFLRPDQLDWIESAGNYVCLHTGAQSHILRVTMSRLEEKLDPEIFRRVHRTAIVNINQVKEIRSTPTGEYRVFLQDGTQIPLGRKYRDQFLSSLDRLV